MKIKFLKENVLTLATLLGVVAGKRTFLSLINNFVIDTFN